MPQGAVAKPPKKKVIINDLSPYYEVRDQMRNFDLLQWRGKYSFSGKIRAVTGEEVNHTSVVVRIPWMENVVMSVEALDNGLHLWPLSELLRKYNGWCQWYPLKEVHIENQDNFEASKWMMAHLGREYDWSGCLSNWRTLFGWEPKQADAKHLYCSESVFLAAKQRIVREGDPLQVKCGAGLEHLRNVDVAPVPGEDVLRVIGMWKDKPCKLMKV